MSVTTLKIKICFDCKEICRIVPGTYLSMKTEKVFNIKHSGHMTQIISIEEYYKWKKIQENPLERR